MAPTSAGRKMRALVVTKLGDPTQPLSADGPLTLSTKQPVPPMVPNGVRIRVIAAALNFADALQVQGTYQEKPKLPFVPGSEVSGVVTEVADDVHSVKVGDSVAAVLWTGGGFAEHVVTLASNVIRLPGGVDVAKAAGLPVAFGTAHLALLERAKLQAGQRLLVLGAGGGVGVAAVQIGKALGARVVAVARGPDKCAVLEGLGADLVIDTSTLQQPLKAAIKEVAPKGVDVVLDPVGGPLFAEALKCVRWGAHILIIGFAGGIPKVPANVIMVKNVTVHGVYWGSYSMHMPRPLRRSLEDSMQWLAEGKVHVPVSHMLPMEEAPAAFDALLSRKAVGKVLLTMQHGTAKM